MLRRINVYPYRCQMSEAVRWSIKVSKETDLSLRSYLGSRGMKKGDLSRFVEDAVRWRVTDKTVQEIKNEFQDIPVDELNEMIEEAVHDIRKKSQ